MICFEFSESSASEKAALIVFRPDGSGIATAGPAGHMLLCPTNLPHHWVVVKRGAPSDTRITLDH